MPDSTSSASFSAPQADYDFSSIGQVHNPDAPDGDGQQAGDQADGGNQNSSQQPTPPTPPQGAGRGNNQRQEQAPDQNQDQGQDDDDDQQDDQQDEEQDEQDADQHDQGQDDAEGEEADDIAEVMTHYVNAGTLQPTKGKEYARSQAGFDELVADTLLNRFNGFLGGLSESRRQYVMMGLNGATEEDFRQFALLDQQLPTYADLDVTNDNHRTSLLRQVATLDLGEGVNVDKFVKSIEDQGDEFAQAYAEKAKARLQKEVDAQRAEAGKAVQQRQVAEQQAQQQALNTRIELVRKTESVAGMPLSAQDREALIDYAYKPQPNGKTKAQEAITPQFEIAFYHLLMKGFDLAKVTGKPAADILRRSAQTLKGKSGGSANSGVTERNLNKAIENLDFGSDYQRKTVKF